MHLKEKIKVWNSLTQTMQVIIDNDERELNSVLSLVDDDVYKFSEKLKKKYQDKFVTIANPVSNNFSFCLIGNLLNECICLIDWKGLAEHYIAKKNETKQTFGIL